MQRNMFIWNSLQRGWGCTVIKYKHARSIFYTKSVYIRKIRAVHTGVACYLTAIHSDETLKIVFCFMTSWGMNNERASEHATIRIPLQSRPRD